MTEEAEQRMSNRQIERLLDQQTEHLTEYITLALKPILEQTTKTNGRVTRLESKMTNVEKYAWFAALVFIGCWALFIALVSSGHLINMKF